MEQHFPQIPSSYEAFRISRLQFWDYIRLSQEQLVSLNETILRSGLNPDAITLSFLLAKKSKPVAQVLKHASALLQAMAFTRLFHTKFLAYQVGRNRSSMRTNPDFLKLLKGLNRIENDIWKSLEGIGITRSNKKKVKLELDVPPRLLTEELMRVLHTLIARDLMPEDAGVPAGQYRIDNRFVGWDIVFPAPELIPTAMPQYVAKTQELLAEALADRRDRFLAAAQISYDFVRIHPFPDFNGRVSRLLLMMILNACGVPFPVTLRGDSKNKKRYFRALKFGNAGNLKPYAALIAMRVIQAFEAVEDNLAIAGLPSILNFAERRGRRQAPQRYP